MDFFAEAVWRFYETGRAALQIERDDGYRDLEDISWYLTPYRSFPRFEKQALKFVRGRVLDIGCGAGRHTLYLQRRGYCVTGVDRSSRLLDLARLRGVKNARQTDACGALPFDDGEFDTAILFGNNLGICGTPRKVRRMLRELGRITSRGGRILATTRIPDAVNPRHRAYLERNIALGRAAGQVRLRLVLDGKRGEWFDLLLLAPTELMQMAAKEGWRVAHLFADQDLEYSAVMEKIKLGRLS